MSNKHKVQNDATTTLGTIHSDIQGLDAIHCAVYQTTAGEILLPGQHIGIKDNKAYSTDVKLVGIADPFLKKPIKEGEMFWLIVYPRQITSLRHVWSHPDFPEEEVKAAVVGKEKSIVIAERVIQQAADYLGLSYQELMDGANDYVEDEEYMYMGSNEDYYDLDMESFWNAYETLTGKSPAYKGGFFSCSC